MTKKLLILLCMLISIVFLQNLSGQALHIDDDGIIWIEIEGKQIKLQEYLIPVGTVNSYIGSAAYVPDGWLICDGRKISKTTNNEYEDLVNLLRNVANDDSIHPFIYDCNEDEANLPDLRGRFIRGIDNPGTAQGAAGRDEDAAIRTNELGAVSEDETVVNENTVGGVIGSIQGDAMQRIKGDLIGGYLFVAQANITAHGALDGEDIGESRSGSSGSSGTLKTSITFDSKKSISPTEAKTSDYETRPKNIALNYIIKY